MKKNFLSIKLFQSKLIEDRGLLFSFLSVLSGLLSGAITANYPESSLKEKILTLFVSFNTDLADKTKAEYFCGILLSTLLYFFILFACGSNTFGKIPALLVTFFKATGITAVIAFLYAQYGLKGLEYCLLVYIPGKILLIFAMLFFTKACFDFSCVLSAGFTVTAEAKTLRRVFLLKAAVSLLILVLSAATDFLSCILFASLFQF